MNSYYKCGSVLVGDKEHKVKFSKYARHDDDVLKLDAISKSIESKLESLGLSVIGTTYLGKDGAKHVHVLHLGSKENGAWASKGTVEARFS